MEEIITLRTAPGSKFGRGVDVFVWDGKEFQSTTEFDLLCEFQQNEKLRDCEVKLKLDLDALQVKFVMLKTR